MSLTSFSALQRAENSSIVEALIGDVGERLFQCSSASRKFLNRRIFAWIVSRSMVSVLFSEPKIPQSSRESTTGSDSSRFSALQRAENSSIRRRLVRIARRTGFSALQRAENSSIFPKRQIAFSDNIRFSALQRAENSSIRHLVTQPRGDFGFQCSSASRKFLNTHPPDAPYTVLAVSVLFSEPKIPQFRSGCGCCYADVLFQCSSASRKFLNTLETDCRNSSRGCFSALQRAENSSMRAVCAKIDYRKCFSALQRAENSSISTLAPASIHISDRDDHASSFLSLPGASP